MQQVKSQLNKDDIRECIAEDIQNPELSHQEWEVANEFTMVSLDHKCKEPRKLLFCIGAIYEFFAN